MIKSLYTLHKPQEHSAYMLNGECIVDPQGTEIDLVRELKKIGIDLRKFTFFNNRGNEECFVVSWEVTDARS